MMQGKQQTIRFHVDDLMSSHADKDTNTKFLKWLNNKYGKYGEVKATRGSTHEYLGMVFEFKNNEVKISMREYVQDMVWDFSVQFEKKGSMTCPAGVDLFNEDTGKKLGEKDKEIFHRTVAKALFLCKRARPDIQTVVSVLCTRVKKPGKPNWNKFARLIKYLLNISVSVRN